MKIVNLVIFILLLNFIGGCSYRDIDPSPNRSLIKKCVEVYEGHYIWMMVEDYGAGEILIPIDDGNGYPLNEECTPPIFWYHFP